MSHAIHKIVSIKRCQSYFISRRSPHLGISEDSESCASAHRCLHYAYARLIARVTFQLISRHSRFGRLPIPPDSSILKSNIKTIKGLVKHMDKAKMGTFIKEQRMALGMTQQQLAEQLHITNKAISRWETGNAYPDIALLDDLAAALSVSVEELCRGERIALPSADTNTLLSDVITEVRQQKKTEPRNGFASSVLVFFP